MKCECQEEHCVSLMACNSHPYSQSRILNRSDVETHGRTEYLHEVLEELQQGLTRCARSINRQNNMYQPIAKLPNELVLQVLEYCVHYDLRTSPPKYFSPATSLCSRWRQIAINAPSLWSTILVPSPRRIKELFLERCGETYPGKNYPHGVILSNSGHLHSSETSSTSHLESPEMLLDHQLFPFPERIKHFEIQWQNIGRHPDASSLEDFSMGYLSNYRYPLLQTLTVDDDDPRDCPLWSLNAPAITHLRFRGDPLNCPRHGDDHLKSLYFEWHHMNPAQILDLLERLDELEHCHILDTRPTYSGVSKVWFDEDPLSLERLQSLSISTLYLSDMHYLLKYLDFPTSANIMLRILPDPAPGLSLEQFLLPRLSLPSDELQISEQELYVEYMMTSSPGLQGRLEVIYLKDGGREEQGLTGLVSKLGKLSRVTLDLPVSSILDDVDASDLTTILTSWPLLTHLCISCKEVDLEAFFIVLESTPEIVCPLLESLDCAGTEFSGPRMVEFLLFRQEAGVGLRKLKVGKTCFELHAEEFSSYVLEVYMHYGEA
ncbi:hypothetical protein SISSUDRAFT_62021 [Sistotremastrum suecicum HHB10207 ss-3]|uniref:Uncharacterized protein n=1 Tax=Sistotremastrum suecicum HHB10207 ss-3 TaxID=1314776 RepID=A0A166BJS0_9AGAM|nr:hypothetical protein SISSUDRAFT_62021 [Sistotremastrum suecicum HHB10207 ss-3]